MTDRKKLNKTRNMQGNTARRKEIKQEARQVINKYSKQKMQCKKER